MIYSRKPSFAEALKLTDEQILQLRKKCPGMSDTQLRKMGNESDNNEVWRHLRCLYGIPSAGADWEKSVVTFLATQGIKQCIFDPSVFFKAVGMEWLFTIKKTDDFAVIGSLSKWFSDLMVKKYGCAPAQKISSFLLVCIFDLMMRMVRVKSPNQNFWPRWSMTLGMIWRR